MLSAREVVECDMQDTALMVCLAVDLLLDYVLRVWYMAVVHI